MLNRENIKNRFFNIIINQKIFILLILLIIILSVTTKTFLTIDNLINILYQITINGIIAIGMTYIFIIGEIDLSVGSNLALVSAFIIIFLKYGIFIGILAGILIGIIVGSIVGLLVIKLKLPSIAATLGMLILIRGVVFLLTNGQTITISNSLFSLIANGTFIFIPYPVYLFLILCLLFELILSKTFFGRNIFAIGGNRIASEYAGIKVGKNRFFVFSLMGFFVGIAGVIQTSRMPVASVLVGINTPIDIIIAVILGGTSLAGGIGSVLKTFSGVLLIGVVSNMLTLLKIHTWYHLIIKGLLLIIVLTIDSIYIKIRKYRFE